MTLLDEMEREADRIVELRSQTDRGAFAGDAGGSDGGGGLWSAGGPGLPRWMVGACHGVFCFGVIASRHGGRVEWIGFVHDKGRRRDQWRSAGLGSEAAAREWCEVKARELGAIA